MEKLIKNNNNLVYLNLNEQVTTYGGGAPGDAAYGFGWFVGTVVKYGTPFGSFYDAYNRWK